MKLAKTVFEVVALHDAELPVQDWPIEAVVGEMTQGDLLGSWKVASVQPVGRATAEAEMVALDNDGTFFALEEVEEVEVQPVTADVSGARFAKIAWSVDDVLALRPGMTEDAAREWLSQNERRIQERLVEVGFEVMDTLLMVSGIERGADPDEEETVAEASAT